MCSRGKKKTRRQEGQKARREERRHALHEEGAVREQGVEEHGHAACQEICAVDRDEAVIRKAVPGDAGLPISQGVISPVYIAMCRQVMQ